MSLMEGIQPNGLPEAVSLDGYGNLRVAIESSSAGGDASAANQVIQSDLLESIELQTRLGAGWFAKKFKKLLLSDMTGSGIDLTAITPAGRVVVAVMASRTTTNGTTIYLEAQENDPGVYVDLNFGLGATWYGEWKTIGPSTSNGCFPLWVLFS